MTAITDMPNGLHQSVPESQYHAKEIGVVSNSALTELLRSPAHYRAWVAGEREKESDALSFGKAFHCALLEPDRFAQLYVVAPEFGDCRYKANKALRNAWLAENSGKEPVAAEWMGQIAGMVASVRRHSLVREMLRTGEAEVTALWEDRATGLRCKTRSDFLQRARGLAVDIKTTEDAREKPFVRSVVNYGYHRQDALYRMGYAACGVPIQYFVIVAVEKSAPWAVATYQLDVAAVQLGWASVRHGIDRMAECVKADRWDAYEETIRTLELPPWAA